MMKSVKNLKYLCVKNIVDTCFKDGLSDENYFYNVVIAFQKLRPYLTKQIFNKSYENKHADFHKFLWFLNCLVKNINIRSEYLTCVKINCNKLSQINFFGFKYLDGKVFFALKNSIEYRYGSKLK